MMNIEKVSNGYVVEVELETSEMMTASDVIALGTKKIVCPDIITLLNFINSYWGNDEAESIVMKEV